MSLSTNLLDALSPKNRIFVAYSGGLDSTALLFLCNKALKQKKISNLKAIHINHNLSKKIIIFQKIVTTGSSIVRVFAGVIILNLILSW